MSSLREELLKYKERQQQIIDEAAVAWVQNNIILINERLNRSAISRLTNSIARFDEKFGPFKEKLPAIQNVLDDAETGLQLVLTGKTSDSRATDMLRNLSLVYSLLSDFFGGDLPALLKTPIFRAAKENPEVRLDSLSGPKYNPVVVADTLANALRPSKDELKMLGKVYKNIPLPNLNVEDISKQLLSLSYMELQKLSEVGKVPMVAMPGDLSDEGKKASDASARSSQDGAGAQEVGVGGNGSSRVAPVGQTPQSPGTPMSVVSPPHPAKVGAPSPVQAVAQGDPNLPKNKPVSLEEDLLEEAPDLTAINKAMADLDVIFQKVPDLKASPLYNAVTGLRKQAQQAATGQAEGRIMSFLKGGGGIGALAKDPAGRIIAQAQMAVDMFKKLGEAWPKISNLFSDGSFDEDDKTQLNAILTKELQGGVFKQLKDAFGVQPYQGLSIPDIVSVVSGIAAQGAPAQAAGANQDSNKTQIGAGIGTQGTQTAGSSLVGEVSKPFTVSTTSTPLTESLEDLKKFFMDLNTSFKPQPSPVDQVMSRGAGGGTAKSPGVAGAKSSKTSRQPQTTTGSRVGQPAPAKQNFGSGQQSTQPVAGSQQAQSQQQSQQSVELKPTATDAQLQAITRITGVEPDRLRKLAQTRGIRISVDPSYLQVR